MSQWCCYLVTISRIQITEAFETCFRFLHIMWCDTMKLMIRTVCGRAFEDTKFEDGGGIGEASSPGGIWVTVEFLKREIMDIGYWIVIRGTSPFARGARVHYIAPPPTTAILSVCPLLREVFSTLPVAVAPSSSEDNTVRCVVPVWWMTSCFNARYSRKYTRYVWFCPFTLLRENKTSYTKPEVHTVVPCRQPRSQVTCSENLLKFGHVVFDICERTDRQTDTAHSDFLIIAP